MAHSLNLLFPVLCVYFTLGVPIIDSLSSFFLFLHSSPSWLGHVHSLGSYWLDSISDGWYLTFRSSRRFFCFLFIVLFPCLFTLYIQTTTIYDQTDNLMMAFDERVAFNVAFDYHAYVLFVFAILYFYLVLWPITMKNNLQSTNVYMNTR